MKATTVPYPAVSVCVDNAFKSYLESTIFNMSLDNFSEIETIVKDNVWTREETFFFLNQQRTENFGFPCFTSANTNDPGKESSINAVQN